MAKTDLEKLATRRHVCVHLAVYLHHVIAD